MHSLFCNAITKFFCGLNTSEYRRKNGVANHPPPQPVCHFPSHPSHPPPPRKSPPPNPMVSVYPRSDRPIERESPRIVLFSSAGVFGALTSPRTIFFLHIPNQLQRLDFVLIYRRKNCVFSYEFASIFEVQRPPVFCIVNPILFIARHN